MELEESYDRNRGSGSGTAPAYTIEARCTSRPKKVGDIILDKEWRNIDFTRGNYGVPLSRFNRYIYEQCGMFNYQAAQALRWWFHAELENEPLGGLCIDTRLVKHLIKYSYSAEAIGQHDIVDGKDRSNIMPDGNKDV